MNKINDFHADISQAYRDSQNQLQTEANLREHKKESDPSVEIQKRQLAERSEKADSIFGEHKRESVSKPQTMSNTPNNFVVGQLDPGLSKIEAPDNELVNLEHD